MKPSAIKHNFGAKSMILEDFWTKTMPVRACEGVMGCGFGVLEVNYCDKWKNTIFLNNVWFFEVGICLVGYFELKNSEYFSSKIPGQQFSDLKKLILFKFLDFEIFMSQLRRFFGFGSSQEIYSARLTPIPSPKTQIWKFDIFLTEKRFMKNPCR